MFRLADSRPPPYLLARGHSYGFAGVSGGELGAGGAVGKTFIVGGTVVLADDPGVGGATLGGVCGFADFKNVRSSWLASIAA
jgi:hypothetical protein